MALPLKPPVLPQLARSRAALPEGDGWAYEPKWDGFRSIVFVDADNVELQSRNGKSLTRYFPELRFPDGRYVLDGEIVAASFDTLGQRIHPAASRIARLAEETPSRFVAFDLLACGDEILLERSYDERRAALEAVEGLELTPVVRTVDAVVLGWRPGKAERTVGALILGLYDGQRLREVGHSSGFTAKEKRELVDFLAPYETGERGSGEASRWTQGRELEWVELRPELVVEITFDHVSDGRIRHGSKVQRWREDKAPEACTVDQLDQ